MVSKPEGPEEVTERPTIVIAWDPEVLTQEEYAELVAAIGTLARAHGGLGIRRLESFSVGVLSGVLV